MKRFELVIFDLDGTLVDSESLCNQALLDLIPQLRADTSLAWLVRRYRGQKLAQILADIQKVFHCSLEDAFESRYRAHVQALFSRQLRPVEGVPEMLDAVESSKCVASSGPPAKIRHALQVCGLWEHFRGRVYSSYDIGSWKPDPGLYHHVMSDMGFRPDQCAVIEDSEVGIQAALSAGVTAFWYAPEGITSGDEKCVVFQAMSLLPGLLASRGHDARY